MNPSDAFFLKALEYLLFNEGGFVFNPKDPGGPTNLGITQGTLAGWRGRPVSADDVRALTRDEAAEIYRLRYWKPLGCDQITSLAACTAMLDMGVLFGVHTSALYAQEALAVNGFPGLKVDGFVGPKTVAALNAMTDVRSWLISFKNFFLLRIKSICADRPASMCFANGWEVRVVKLLTLAPVQPAA